MPMGIVDYLIKPVSFKPYIYYVFDQHINFPKKH